MVYRLAYDCLIYRLQGSGGCYLTACFLRVLSLSLLRALLQAIDISMGAAIFEQLTARLATTFWAAV